MTSKQGRLKATTDNYSSIRWNKFPKGTYKVVAVYRADSGEEIREFYELPFDLYIKDSEKQFGGGEYIVEFLKWEQENEQREKNNGKTFISRRET